MTDRGKERTLPIAPAVLDRVRAELAASHGKRRLDLIFAAEDPEALVRALPADELYFTIREIGFAEAASLVPLASAAQFRTFLDLDCWRGSEIDPLKVLPWIRAALSGAGDSPRAERHWVRKLAAIDREMLSLVLRHTLIVHDLELNPDPDLQSDRFMRTPEGKYVVEFTVDGVDYMAIRGLLDHLLAEDPFTAVRLLEAVRWDFESELHESALRWRTGRLADLGYPSLEEALSYFARPPSQPSRAAGVPTRPAGFFLATLRKETLLDRAMAKLPPEDRDSFERETMSAANAVLIADAVEVDDVDAVRSAFEATRALLEMGLIELAGPEPIDEAHAAEVLVTTPVKRIFQHGFGRTLELAWRAQRLFSAGGAGTAQAPLLDAPLGEAMSALVKKRPLYFPGIEAPRSEWGTLAAAAFQPRRFLALAEVSSTAAMLDQAEGLAALARKLGLAAPPDPGPLTPRLSARYLTALANERLGRTFSPSPIPAAELAAAVAALATVDDPRLMAEGEPGRLLLEMARALSEELAPLRDGSARPTQVSVLIVQD